MNIRALILFACVAIYMVETSAVGYKNCVNGAAVSMEKTHMCCSGQKECAKERMARPAKKDSETDCHNMDNCLNCPVCYLAIVPASDMPATVFSIHKRQYQVFRIDYNSYCGRESWKPPDGI